MINPAQFKIIFLVVVLQLLIIHTNAQQVPIKSYQINDFGQVQLTVTSTNQNYYVLKVRTDSNSAFNIATKLVLGEIDSTVISEPLGHYPIDHYQVIEYTISSPFDTDEDSVNDIAEQQFFPTQNPLNPAPPIWINDGVITIDSFSVFNHLSITKEQVQWSEFLNGKGFVKYMITDFNTNPKIYFINSKIHNLHADFAAATGITQFGSNVIKGQVIYHPKNISNNGTEGTFAFNFSNGHGKDFSVVQKTNELLAANMPFLQNNLSYFVTENSEDEYSRDSLLFEQSRVAVLFEKDVYSNIDYWGLNQTEGYGLFRRVQLDEIPRERDIVMYDALPNSLPRVAGIITSVFQTPLSHVNLRAIQNKVPNAFIRDPLAIDSIANLLDKYIYFKTEQDGYIIREATVEEVNNWFDKSRPTQAQTPPLNLEYQSILALNQIDFSMYDGFGAKCANVATMGTFNFPDSTIPDGYGVPFYFYQEFMKQNGFFDVVRRISTRADFKADRNVRDQLLSDLRSRIKSASMPIWMLNELESMHRMFPSGTSVRCRSSSNNEDLPGFNGAGLYSSKTQHPDEGHISKSIKQVYASLWNLRAYEEREFYKVDHYISSMGVLCHPNYSNEKSNGVGVSQDPIYNTDSTFYLNTQVGDELITNPDNFSIAEEILLNREASANDYVVVQRSNLIKVDSLILSRDQLNRMRTYLTVIHNEFEKLYGAEGNSTFAMDIEYKVTSNNRLIIKQARPWVDYEPAPTPLVLNLNSSELFAFPNPAENQIYLACNNCQLNKVKITDLSGRKVFEKEVLIKSNSISSIQITTLPPGIYVISGFSSNGDLFAATKFIKR